MNGSRSAWWPLHRRDHRQSREPGAALFQGLRVRLTLWYSGVLCAALVLFGVALYFGVQILLLSPVKADLSAHIQQHLEKLLTDSYLACSSTTFGPPAPDQPFGQAPLPELVACDIDSYEWWHILKVSIARKRFPRSLCTDKNGEADGTSAHATRREVTTQEIPPMGYLRFCV